MTNHGDVDIYRDVPYDINLSNMKLSCEGT